MTPEQKAKWLEERRTGITGTDAAIIMGANENRTLMDVYMDKMGTSEPMQDNEYLYWGRALEPVVANAYAERLERVAEASNVVTGRSLAVCEPEDLISRSRAQGWMLASPDRLIFEEVYPDYMQHDGYERFGNPEVRWGLEIKTAGYTQRSKWSNPKKGEPTKIPPAYEYQCRWYMAVLELDRWDVAVLIGGNDYRQYTLHRSLSIEEAMVDRCRSFWFNHVVAKVPPY